MIVRTLCTRALRRAGVSPALADPAAEDAIAALAHLNEMVRGWAVNGVDILLQADYGLDDEFRFWVPPIALEEPEIASVNYAGTYDATTSLPSSPDTGDTYRVTVAVGSYAVDDWIVYDGSAWLKSIDSRRFDGGIIAMLTVKIGSEYGTPVPDDVRADAIKNWRSMVPYYAKPPLAQFDSALTSMPSRSIYLDWSAE